MMYRKYCAQTRVQKCFSTRKAKVVNNGHKKEPFSAQQEFRLSMLLG